MDTYVVDSGNVTRKLKTLWVVDSGAVSRRIKKLWVIDSGNVARLVFTGQDDLSLVAGTAGGSSGYVLSGFGSLIPTTLGDGKTVNSLFSSDTSPFPLTFVVTGFSSDPTSAYLTDIVVNGVTLLASAAVYAYSGGQAQWAWASGARMFSGTTYPIVVQRSG
jgi:hypothetical protein